MSGYKIELVARQAEVQAIGNALEDLAVAIAAFEIVPGGDWRIEAYTTDEPDDAEIKAALVGAAESLGRAHFPYHIAPLPPVDWLAENRRNFPPQGFGRFFIHGSHFEGRPPAGRIALLIDAATAFGSGEHETTRGCLISIDALAKQRRIRRPLDIGCGSGILALAMARIWRRPVLATDIDPGSVLVARENAEINRVSKLVRVERSDGYRHRLVGRGRPYDLIVSNILARPLCRLAPALSRHLQPGGYAILSGLLVSQEAQVLAAHVGQGMALVKRRRRNGWSTLVLKKRGGR